MKINPDNDKMLDRLVAISNAQRAAAGKGA
jgi:hypothetical protein